MKGWVGEEGRNSAGDFMIVQAGGQECEQRTESYGFRLTFGETLVPCRAALSQLLERLVKYRLLRSGYARIAGKLVTRSPRVPFTA